MNSGNEIFNGKVIHSSEQGEMFANRAFRYGDGVFETMRIHNGNLLFAEDHLTRLNKGTSYLGIHTIDSFDPEQIPAYVNGLCQDHSIENGRARLTVYRNSGGYYTPDSGAGSWHLTVSELNNYRYHDDLSLSEIGIYSEELKTTGTLANIKSLNCLVYVLAGAFARRAGWSDAFILNTSNRIAEAISSNIFFRKGETYITPPLSEGCLDGVMRKKVMEILNGQGNKVTETPVSLHEILNYDEIILTNVISGARSAQMHEGKKYASTGSAMINELLNQKYLP